MRKGKFIVLEGLDCTGKSTIAEHLAKEFNASGEQWIHVRCPSDVDGTASAEIRKLILYSGLTFNKDVLAMLFGAAIIDLIHSTIKPALNDGVNVICERFTMSSRVYQAGSHAMSKIVECVEEQIRPDLTIVYDIPPEIYLERLAQRNEKDNIETTDIDEINQRRKMYRKLYIDAENCVAIDAAPPLMCVIAETVQAIELVVK